MCYSTRKHSKWLQQIFLSGGFEGNGEIHGVLCGDAFYPSGTFDPCVQLLKVIKAKNLNRDEVEQILNAILIQPEGGPDHIIALLRNQISFVDLFIALMNYLALGYLATIRGVTPSS